MEKKSGSVVLRALLAVVVLFAVGIAGASLINKLFLEESAPDEVYTWTAPTEGPPVHHYEAQVIVNRGDTLFYHNLPTTRLTFSAKYGTEYKVRVAGVDSENRQGPWSGWSIPYFVKLDDPSTVTE